MPKKQRHINRTGDTTMRSIPVDTSRINFIASGKCVPRAVYAVLSDGSKRRVPDNTNAWGYRQATDENGMPLWTLDVLPDDDDAQRAEVVSVTIASFDEPKVDKFQSIRFRNLVASAYVREGRVAFSFRAEGIDSSADRLRAHRRTDRHRRPPKPADTSASRHTPQATAEFDWFETQAV
jgi:hypothetical protein